MNQNITSFYVVNLNNQTVAFGSNLKELYENFNHVETECRNYQYYYRKFQKESEFILTIDGKEYNFQQLV